MVELRWRGFWWGLGIALLAAIATLSLVSLQGPAIEVPNIDKLNHALAYIVLACYFGQLTTLPRAFGMLLGYGIGIEALQAQTPHRHAEIADLLANGIGMLLGWFLLRTQLGGSLRAIERYLGLARD